MFHGTKKKSIKVKTSRKQKNLTKKKFIIIVKGNKLSALSIETHSVSNCCNIFSSSSRLLFNDVREPRLLTLRLRFNEFPGERLGVW